ncbi:hypothetical protein C8J57DRAFT_1522169 [Mycena rebaudengoi]|nr:hypothetical protein C8J57DRAFT_1522169 [Mycena rebaudengoi]
MQCRIIVAVVLSCIALSASAVPAPDFSKGLHILSREPRVLRHRSRSSNYYFTLLQIPTSVFLFDTALDALGSYVTLLQNVSIDCISIARMLCSLSKPSLNQCRDCIVTAKHPPSSKVTFSAFTDSELQLVLTYLLAQELRPTTKRVMLRKLALHATASVDLAMNLGDTQFVGALQHLPECPEPRMVISICVLLGSIASREALSAHLVECGACLALLSLLEHGEIATRRAATYALCKITSWPQPGGQALTMPKPDNAEYVLQDPVRDSCPGLSRMLLTSATGELWCSDVCEKYPRHLGGPYPQSLPLQM